MWKQETRRTETKIKQGDFLQWCARYRVSQLQPQIIFQGPTMQRPTTIWARKTATLKNTALPAKGWKMLCSCSTLAIHRKCRSSVLSSRTKVVDLVMRCGCRKKKKKVQRLAENPPCQNREHCCQIQQNIKVKCLQSQSEIKGMLKVLLLPKTYVQINLQYSCCKVVQDLKILVSPNSYTMSFKQSAKL